jgi:RsiW-degrading membrane proteinase PrsW (M82 family)
MILRVLVVFVALACTGCVALGFDDDVELVYEADASLDNAKFGEDLRALVLRRLGAAQIGADVTTEGRSLRIVVDEPLSSAVDELVVWRGTVELYEPIEGHAPIEGTREDVEKAALVGAPTGGRILVEPIRETGRFRTRAVRASPFGELGDATLVSWGPKGTLRLRAPPTSSSGGAIAQARTRPTIVARGRTSLGAPSFDGEVLVLSFGEGARAYARAQKERHLLLTPRLPHLRRIDAVGLPPNRSLATACVVVPIVLSILWLAFVRRFDRAHPEPLWLVGVTFVLGALATLPAGIAEIAATRVSPWLDPRLVTFGGQAFALPLAFVVMTVVIGFSEEGAKLAAAVFASRRREFDEPVDGIVYGIVASLGFAAAENARYFVLGRLAPPLVIGRCFMSVPAHMFTGALWGYALGARLLGRTRISRWFLFAAAAHGLFDALLSTEGMGTLAVVLNVALASTFVVLVRRALRHGIVEPEMLAISPEERRLFRAGRPALFWLSAVGLHVTAFAIFLLGAWYQLARHRPALPFVVGSTVALALFGFAAYGVSAAVPLDVAIDDWGVTFAGAARPWRKIRGFARKDRAIEIDCEAGPLILGPAAPSVLDAIAAELTAHLGGSPNERKLTLESAR